MHLNNGGMLRSAQAPNLLIERTLTESRAFLNARLQLFLSELRPALREDMYAALASEGKLLHQPVSELDGRWALLPFILACDLTSHREKEVAGAVALAVECVVCSTDLLDDAMDGDVTPLTLQLGQPRTLNAALALLSLGQRILLSLSDRPGVPVARLLETLYRALLRATAGQQQDLLAETRCVCTISWKECLSTAEEKAGALLSLACRLGALCANVEEERVEQWAEMGCLLGIAAQLDNDAHDLAAILATPYEAKVSQKSDLARGKKTLPIVLAAHSLRAEHAWESQRVEFALRAPLALQGDERTHCLDALYEGSLAGWGTALLYRERARDVLQRIEQYQHVSPVLRFILGLVS